MISITATDKLPAALAPWERLYLRNKDGFAPFKAIKKFNRTVYGLLYANTNYEPSIQSYKTQHVEEGIPMQLKIWDFLLVSVGLRR